MPKQSVVRQHHRQFPYFDMVYTHRIKLMLDALLRGPDVSQGLKRHAPKPVTLASIEDYARYNRQFNVDQLWGIAHQVLKQLNSYLFMDKKILSLFEGLHAEVQGLLKSCTLRDYYSQQKDRAQLLLRYKQKIEMMFDTAHDPRPYIEKILEARYAKRAGLMHALDNEKQRLAEQVRTEVESKRDDRATPPSADEQKGGRDAQAVGGSAPTVPNFLDFSARFRRKHQTNTEPSDVVFKRPPQFR
jgi:hypothetical protein